MPSQKPPKEEIVIEQLIHELNLCIDDPSNEQTIPVYASQIHQLPANEKAKLLDALNEFAELTDDSIWPGLFVTLLGHLALADGEPWPGVEYLDSLNRLYRACPEAHALRCHLLAIIANHAGEESQDAWADLLCNDPPKTGDGIRLAFAPLLKADTGISHELLKKLINEATGNLIVAPAVYDLANHAYRTKKVESHPASDRRQQLCELLGALVGKLSEIEEGNLPADSTPEVIAQTVSNAVATIIALTDTVALLKEDTAIGKLNQAIELRHRRIQVEAAAALASLGAENGKQKLIECAEHPNVRQRAIAYATELGIDSEISLEYKGPIATAESFLAMWLTEPSQMGIAPTTLKLIDQRELFWPGYDKRVSCFLFEYRYGIGENSHVNIGISGPLTHAFSADLTKLSVADQYAAFAGWQTVSDEIFLIPVERAEKLVTEDTERLKKLLNELPMDSTTLEVVCGFFGKHVLVATGSKDGVSGTIFVDEEQSDWIDCGNAQAPIDWRTALDIWQGRKLLSSFNPAVSS